jgi:DNA-directed RNA polymerase specialized sigma24 family protein
MAGDRVDRGEALLMEWAAWLRGSGERAGYSSMSPLHVDWSPPSPGTTPTLRTVRGTASSGPAVHRAVLAMSVRAQQTLLLHYVLRRTDEAAAAELGCGASTVRARLVAARRAVVQAVS